MKEALKILEQGFPTLLFLLSTSCLALGFFEVRSFTPFSFAPKIYLPLIAVAFVILLLAIGLWVIDRQKPKKVEDALHGHFILIKLLVKYSDGYSYHSPGDFTSLMEFNGAQEAAERAARYGSMYLQELGLLEGGGSEFRATQKANVLLQSTEFRAKNSGAFS